MQQSNFFLRTKLLPPRAVSELLERPRLTDRLKANSEAGITLVAADAGYGKTTLIADFLRQGSRPAVWYQLDHTDADPVVFLNYVAHGIKQIVPEFGEALFAYLSEANEDLLRFPEKAADLLINEILRCVEQPFVLVLDDYHHIGVETAVHKIVDRVLQYSSEYLHLIITTRDLPPLAIMRRRSQASALVLNRSDLLFTDDEVRQLFRRTLNIELGDRELEVYRNRTHGWITALQLVRQLAEKEIAGEAPRADLNEMLRRSEKDIFDYFAEEVFSREDTETQNLLVYLSLPESLPLERCSLLFPNLRCSAALPELAQKNVFLSVAGEGGASEEYRLHPLFRDFLQRRLRSEIGQAGVTEERNRIAETFLGNNQWEAALPFLLDAENYLRAAEIIAERGDEWISAGAISSLGLFLERIPPEALDTYPRALLHMAEIERLQGATRHSHDLLIRAVRLFEKTGDTSAEAEALHALASLARRKSNHDEALELLQKAEALADGLSETYIKCLNTRGLCLIAMGKWPEAEQQFRAALELAEEQSSERYIRLIAHNLALAPGFRGDFGEALRWFGRMFREDRAGQQFPQQAIGHLNVARLHLYRGEFERTETHLEKALELAQLFNLNSLLPEIFESYANYYREKGDFPHASEFYQRSKNAYEDAGVDLDTREINEEWARFHTLRGDLPRARAMLEKLIESRLKLGRDLAVNTARLCLCEVDLMENNLTGLVDRIEELLEFFHSQNHYYDEALASMLLARTHFELGRTKDLVPLVLRVLDLSARYDYEYWLAGQIRANKAIFQTEDILERLPLDLRELLSSEPSPNIRAVVPAAEATAPVNDLTVNVLGPAEIFRDPTKPFAADAWTTRRARDIFCYIATSKHRRVPKDVLIETFWGEEDPETVEKNFHPTISHIRKALNSRQSLKQNYLVFRDGAYQLNPEYKYFIDTEEFLNAIAAAEAAKREKDLEVLQKHLEHALTLYRGDFLEGSYEDWAEEQRHYFREQYLRVLNGLAKSAVSEKRWNDALKFANNILAIDPYREDLHRLVMKVLAAQSKAASVKKHFEGMREILKAELGIEPSAETKKLFQELVK